MANCIRTQTEPQRRIPPD